MKLVLASDNKNKLREFRTLFENFGVELISKAESGFTEEVVETGETFAENARIKAEAVMRATGLAAIADDSGLCVDALGGAPGVQSARYAGEPKSDTRNNEKLVADLAPHADKRGRYVCVLVFVRHPDDPQPIIAEGEWHGEIIATPRGAGGFGYDPYFLLPSLGQTAAELPAEEKNRCSHRGLALQALVKRLG